MKTVFFANIWTELLSVQFLELLESMGYKSRGNWFAGKYFSENPMACRAGLLVYSPIFPDAGYLVNEQTLKSIPTIFWGLFPDYLMGWNFQKESYEMEPRSEIVDILPKCDFLLAPSNYVAKLLTNTYSFKFNTTHLGVPINEMVKNSSKRNSR